MAEGLIIIHLLDYCAIFPKECYQVKYQIDIFEEKGANRSNLLVKFSFETPVTSIQSNKLVYENGLKLINEAKVD